MASVELCFPRRMAALGAHGPECAGARAEGQLAAGRGSWEALSFQALEEQRHLQVEHSVTGDTGWAYPVQRKPTQRFCWSVMGTLVQVTQPLQGLPWHCSG